MTAVVALLDANILYPAPLRDVFLQLAVSDLVRARWTEDIHREWIEALLRREPRRDRAALARTQALMDAHVRDALVTGYRPLAERLILPDPRDRHVLAAAIVGRCEIIVTRNLRDFPAEIVGPLGIAIQHPDAFLGGLFDLTPGAFLAAIRTVRARLKAPPFGVDDYLAVLRDQGLGVTAGRLAGFSHLI